MWRPVNRHTLALRGAKLFGRFLEVLTSYKDILVFLDAGRAIATRLDLAVSLCQRFDAEFVDTAADIESMFEAKIKESPITSIPRLLLFRRT